MLHRRDLIRAAGSSAAALTASSYSKVLGANDRVHLGVIGCGGRGKHMMGHFIDTGQVEVTALCDVYGVRIDEARNQAPNATSYTDHRKLLEHRELDAVLIATPDHWHAGTAIDSMNAGKDVYVEKPLTRTIDEGPKIIRAARVNERVCQVGMQQRSGAHYWKAKAEYIDSGALGKIGHVRTVWHSGVGSSRRPFVKEKPSNLDWARYLGPVKWREWNAGQYFRFRNYLDFGGGKITDFFAHWGDVVHMFMGVDAPFSAVAAGGVFTHDDGRDAPDTIDVLWEYPGDFTVSFSSLSGRHLEPYGIHFIGTRGRLYINRQKYVFYGGERDTPPVVYETEENITRAHVDNFLECCRTRKRPNGDVYHGHKGAATAHLGTISYVEKRRVRFDPVRERVFAD